MTPVAPTRDGGAKRAAGIGPDRPIRGTRGHVRKRSARPQAPAATPASAPPAR